MTNELEDRLEKEEVERAGILESTIDVSELVNLDCEPAEGFILSRINGRYSCQEVLSQLPGSELHNLVIIHNLLRRDLIKIRHEKGMRVFEQQDMIPPPAMVVNQLEDPFQLED
jgi:hypothetical protein